MSYAKRCPQQIQRELEQVNPSVACSLEAGLEETLILHRLEVPAEVRTSVRTTKPNESAFSRVRNVCRNVRRWQPRDHRERRIRSGLIFAEQTFRRIVGYKGLPKLIPILEGLDTVVQGGQSGRVDQEIREPYQQEFGNPSVEL